jgi:hypothetical protein
VNNRSRSADVYLYFLKLTEHVQGSPALLPLEPIEKRILEIIVYSRLKKERLSVKDLMNKRALGSPSMLHGRLKIMRSKGWVELEETEDGRRKQVVPTKAAMTHIDKLSRLMVRAVKKTGLF